MNDTFQTEIEAYQALSALMAKAAETRDLFAAADLPIPAPLARLLNEQASPETRPDVGVLRHRRKPTPPVDAEPGWIWVSAKDMQVSGLVHALLKEAGRPVMPRHLIDRLSRINPKVPSGSVYNVGPKSKEIIRSDDGWSIKDPLAVPTLHGDKCWGPPEVFLKQELAAHRRQLILDILKSFNNGLQVMQIVDQLDQSGECRAPFSKDLVKTDVLRLLDEDRIKRHGRTRKYVAVDQ